MLYDLFFYWLVLDFKIMYYLLKKFVYSIYLKKLISDYRTQHIKISIESTQLKKDRFQSLIDEAVEGVVRFKKDQEDLIVMKQREFLLKKDGGVLIPMIETNIKMLDECILQLEKEIIEDLSQKINELEKKLLFVSPIHNPLYSKLFKTFYKRKLCKEKIKFYSKINRNLYCRW